MSGAMAPSRGDVWLVQLDPVRGHEQAGQRPCLVVSVDLFNHGPAGLCVVLPITSREKKIPFHVGLKPPEGGLAVPSFIKGEDIRSVSVDRLVSRLGAVSTEVIENIEDRLRILLGL